MKNLILIIGILFMCACGGKGGGGGDAAPTMNWNPPANYFEVTPNDCTEVVVGQRWARVISANTIRYYNVLAVCQTLGNTAAAIEADITAANPYLDPWDNLEILISPQTQHLSDPNNVWAYLQ